MKPIGFLAYDGVEELDLIGPWEMAAMWRDYANGPDCVVIAPEAGVLRCAKGLSVVAHHGFDDAPELHALLVPGGFAAFDLIKDPRALDYVRQAAAAADHVMSVCSGAFILLAAGLLEGKSATTHWKALPALHEAGVDVVEQRYVRDGSIWTSGGVSAGIDLFLHFLAETQGPEVASLVQHNAEYYPEGRLYGDHHRAPDMPAYMRGLDG